MQRRTVAHLVMWSLTATAACSGDHPAGPAAPACSSALASQVMLAVGAYLSIDPASDGGCVTFAANASAVDSAEYLLVPQSASGTPGVSSPFRLQDASLQAARLPYRPSPGRASRRPSSPPSRLRWGACGRSESAPR
jgi:hypothetical protein